MAAVNDIRQIGLIAAVAQEYAVVSKVFAAHKTQTMVVQSGMGRAAGFLAAETLGRENKALAGLVSIGFCGALDAGLTTGCVIVPDSIVSDNSETFQADTEWARAVVSSLADMELVVSRSLYSATDVIETSDAKQAAQRRSGTCAVDMESAGIAHAAIRFKVPFIAVRIVLDELGDSLPAAIRDAVKPDGNLDVRGLVRGLASNPRDVAPLIKLGRKSSLAQKRLKTVCEALGPGFCLPLQG